MSEKAAVSGKFVQFGDHIDTLETVDTVFRAQRKLSFTYGAVFFGVTLAIPALSVWVPAWYSTPIWGGFTANYFVVSLAYFVFLWVMAWTYSKQADKLDEELMHIAEAIESKAKAGGAQ
ncbi:MAG: hypothetical protein CVT67_04300 [Actinobacteria bacterium HGW-Actinobacteria-7]|jgi:uncharacterized membrane protein (DUF485 family)|nr:MAG: hypothetical protein CVT67_04300 [Actinobacteria bacterium HGW-Actinobacteria-7]